MAFALKTSREYTLNIRSSFEQNINCYDDIKNNLRDHIVNIRKYKTILRQTGVQRNQISIIIVKFPNIVELLVQESLMENGTILT